MSVRIAILTVSDGCAHRKREDRSGAAIAAWAAERGYHITGPVIVPDETVRIVSQLIDWADDDHAKIILTTGGTGLGPRDVTPEATRAVIEREAAGISEMLRASGLRQTPRAALSRGVSGTRRNALIINLPGSTSAVSDALLALEPLVPHIMALLSGDTEH